VLYDTMRKSPEPGSLLEVLCIMIQMRRELAEFHKTLCIVQAVRDSEDSGDSTRKAFENYRNSVMPFLKKEVEKENKKIGEVLRREAARGPLRLKVTAKPSGVGSRLVNKIVHQPHVGFGKRGK